MKNIIIYVFLFAAAFIGTTFAIYILNDKYVGLFELDLREKSVVEAAIADSIAVVVADSLAVIDSLENVNNPKIVKENFEEDLNSTKGELNKIEQKLNTKDKEIEKLKKQLEVKQNNEHQEWLKSTIKIYEAMAPNKAAQLLGSISDSDAREIIYKMKKKKAAEILSNLNTETIKRLTRAKK